MNFYYMMQNIIAMLGVFLVVISTIGVCLYATVTVIKDKLFKRKARYLKLIGFRRAPPILGIEWGWRRDNDDKEEYISDTDLGHMSMRKLKKKFPRDISDG